MKNLIGQYLILVFAVLSGIMLYRMFLQSSEVQAPIVGFPTQPQPTYESYVAPTYDLYQATVEAFYAAPPVQVVPTFDPIPTPQPSTRLTACMNTAIYTTTVASEEYVIGYLVQGMTVDIVSRSEDSLWVRMLQSSESYEFWIPAEAFCFGD